MFVTLRKTVVVLSTMILLMQMIIVPVEIVFAETIDELVEEYEKVEHSFIKSDSEESDLFEKEEVMDTATSLNQKEVIDNELLNEEYNGSSDDNLIEKASPIEKESEKASRIATNVSTYEQLEEAINNVNITVINLSADISAVQNLNIGRSLVINGNGFTLDMQKHEVYFHHSGTQLTVKDANLVGNGWSIFAIYARGVKLVFNNVNFSGSAYFTGNEAGGGGAEILFEGGYNTVKTEKAIRAIKEVKIAGGATVYHEGQQFIDVDIPTAPTDIINLSSLNIESGASLISNSMMPLVVSNISVKGKFFLRSESDGIATTGRATVNQVIILDEGSETELESKNNGKIFSNLNNELNLFIKENADFDFKQDNGSSIMNSNNQNTFITVSSNKVALWDLGLQNESKASIVFSDMNLILSGKNGSFIDSTNNERFQRLYDSAGLVSYSRMSNKNVEEKQRTVRSKYLNLAGEEIADSEIINGLLGDNYQTVRKQISGYSLTEIPSTEVGVFTREEIEVIYIYEAASVLPVDPLDPDTEVDPENKPELPEEQGRLSIDFISQFDFGKQSISAQDQTYYARPQRLLNEDGMVNEKEERPNYLQISDRRVENERNGWQLSVRQHSQFKNDDGHELMGASLTLSNHQLVSAQGGKVPGLHPQNTTILTPGATRVLVRAEGDEGTGTWIYRFGDGETASESVALTVPNGATPRAGNYSTKLTWQLSMVPKN